MRAVETDSVKLVRKAKDDLHMACERASETRERTLHGHCHRTKTMRMASLRESRDSDRFQVNTHVATVTKILVHTSNYGPSENTLV